MTKSFRPLLFLVMALLIGTLAGNAQNNKPRWVSKGVEALNNQRSNTSYIFESFNTHDIDLAGLKKERAEVLRKYIVDTYSVHPDSIQIIPTSAVEMPMYKILYTGNNGELYSVDAKLVDEYSYFDDYELNYYEYEYYQLYAISYPNMTPMFDDFEITKKYNSQAAIRSIIPGMGQIYKGQHTKGYVILGGEIAFVGAGLIFEYYRSDAHKMRKQEPEFERSWRSKEISWRNMEIGAAAGFLGLYIYNLIDAYKSEGANQVKIHKRHSHMSMLPFATPYGEIGLSMVLNF